MNNLIQLNQVMQVNNVKQVTQRESKVVSGKPKWQSPRFRWNMKYSDSIQNMKRSPGGLPQWWSAWVEPEEERLKVEVELGALSTLASCRSTRRTSRNPTPLSLLGTSRLSCPWSNRNHHLAALPNCSYFCSKLINKQSSDRCKSPTKLPTDKWLGLDLLLHQKEWQFCWLKNFHSGYLFKVEFAATELPELESMSKRSLTVTVSAWILNIYKVPWFSWFLWISLGEGWSLMSGPLLTGAP